jgi:hypothetical protein
MTLKEKFDWYLSGGENCREVEECFKIAEDFAIGFAEWIRVCKMKGRPYDFENTKELLEIYKEEKGL